MTTRLHSTRVQHGSKREGRRIENCRLSARLAAESPFFSLLPRCRMQAWAGIGQILLAA